ncbi:MAG TPA: hypothetical protein VM409_06370 [Chloroflexia bacterium]|nr:hypothetical protein [Chloroflexia bacterium]
MVFGTDWLANTFIFVFLFGLIFTVASLLLGFAHLGGLNGPHIGGHDFDLHIDGHHVHLGGHDSGHVDAHGHEGPGILNMPTIMAFLTWFGGAGYIFRQSMALNGYVAGGLAIGSGILGGGIMFMLLARVLWPMMSKPLSSADFQKEGTAARVVSPIREGGVGEIVYNKQGTRFISGASSATGAAIPKGAEVVILRYDRGLAYVEMVDTLLASVDEQVAQQASK